MKKMTLRFLLCFVLVMMIVGCDGQVVKTISRLNEKENQNRLEKCSTPPPSPDMMDFFNGNLQPWLIFTKSNGERQSFTWDKTLYYERCTEDKTDGIIIVEFEKDIDIPYVCIPDYNYYNSIDKTESVFSVKTLSKKSPITKDKYEYEAQDGHIERCDNRFCWSPDNQTQDYKKFQNRNQVSMPFLTKDARPILFGFGFKSISDKENKFAVTDLDDFLIGLCDYVGVCPGKPTKPGIPTTTTARTTPRPEPSTDYVPEFLFDEEARDFEEPYFKRNRTRKGGTKREWKITVVFMISLVLLVLE
ncbi:hypothetical protein L5515_010447 [Caenorhabditis briggsae]|uniref:Uncharacterized protein n=1 Tax=Caenorhabditis briggsae TaxID=6238 RepID=A0AAE9EQY9_CAEBR|nr:hypothetical protein L5515_010447 [Caenorhabditis briggsae]